MSIRRKTRKGKICAVCEKCGEECYVETDPDTLEAILRCSNDECDYERNITDELEELKLFSDEMVA